MALEAPLGALERAELIGLAQSLPEVEYAFRHALVQEAAYGSLLRATRRELHRAIGLLLEREFADRLEEQAPILARHFHAAEDLGRAIEYYLLAGAPAARRYANAEALEHFESALQLVRQMRAAPADEIPVLKLGERAYLARGRVLEITGRFVEALAGYRELETWALAAGDPGAERAALMAQATLYNTPTPVYDPIQGRSLMLRVLPLARAAGDRTAEARILWNLMLSHVYSSGDMREAERWGEAALAVATEAGLTEQRALILHDIFFVYMSLYGPDRADAVLVEALDLWRGLNNPLFLAETLVFRCNIAIVTGRYDDALALAEEARRVGIESKHPMSEVYADILLGRVLDDRGFPGRAIAVMEHAVRIADAAENLGVRMFTRIDLGILYGRLGAAARGEAVVAEAGRVMRAHVPFVALSADAAMARLRLLAGDIPAARVLLANVFREAPTLEALQRHLTIYPPAFVDCMLAEAETRLAEGDAPGALAWLDGCLRLMRSRQIRMAIPDAQLLRARALRAIGKPDEIGAALDEAQQVAEVLGSRRIEWQILAERARADGADAPDLRRRARAIVQEIATDLSDEDLRNSYLSAALAEIGA